MEEGGSLVGVANEGLDSLLPGLLLSESAGWEEVDGCEDWRLISNLSIPPDEGTGKPCLLTYARMHKSAPKRKSGGRRGKHSPHRSRRYQQY